VNKNLKSRKIFWVFLYIRIVIFISICEFIVLSLSKWPTNGVLTACLIVVIAQLMPYVRAEQKLDLEIIEKENNPNLSKKFLYSVMITWLIIFAIVGALIILRKYFNNLGDFAIFFFPTILLLSLIAVHLTGKKRNDNRFW
jgi:hypothetical protein